jgi:hypothetical protein
MAIERPGLPSDLSELGLVQSEGSRLTLGKRSTSRGNLVPRISDNLHKLRDSEHSIIVAVDMASVVRPTMLRQTCRAAASKRAFSTKLPTTFLPHSQSASVLSRQTARKAFVKDALPGSMRVAAFHASGRQAILPAEPRMSNPPWCYDLDANISCRGYPRHWYAHFPIDLTTASNSL